MLVVFPDEMKHMEEKAALKGITNEMLMEEAGKGIATITASFVSENQLVKKALVLAGKGNNGGDAYVVARHLLQQGFSVTVWQTAPLDQSSLTKKQRRRFEARSGKVVDLTDTIPEPIQEGVIIDGIFGTGFRGEPEPKILTLIQKINSTNLPIIAVDIPSGLNAQTGDVVTEAIHATITCAIEFPKAGYFIKNGWDHAGTILQVPIGLASFVEKSPFTILDKKEVVPLLPKIVRSRHKYEAGHVVALAGAKGMAGASLLASYAALKAGAGIVHLLHDDSCSDEFAGSALEVVKVAYSTSDLTPLEHWITKASACFVGPGLGNDPQKLALLDKLWPLIQSKKVVIDADAISWLKKITTPLPNCIITPHLGELEKLLGISTKEGVTIDLLDTCQQFVESRNTQLIVKGGPTFLFAAGCKPQVVTMGDPGMATAGAGDVLTGILTALLAQGLSPISAMKLGVFLHGMAGFFAAQEESSYSVTASSIISHIGKSYKSLLG